MLEKLHPLPTLTADWVFRKLKMSSIPSVTITVPATTSNLGPGFDCIGAALTLYNQFKFTRLDLAPLSSPSVQGEETKGVSITVSGAEAEGVNTGTDNLAYQAFLKLYEQLDKTPPPVQIEIQLGVPLARGLGSSATAILGGLVGANLLAGSPLDEIEVMNIAIALEGHPDNVVPALLGGCRLAATNLINEPSTGTNQAFGNGDNPKSQIPNPKSNGGWEICDIPWHSDIVPVVAIPDFELSTAEARRVLPAEYSRADAIFNAAHLGLLLRGLETGRGEWLRSALQDRIHQPYRKALIPGYDAVYSAAVAAGAYGMVISGAGSTVLALVDSAQAVTVEAAMAAAWKEEGITASVQALQIDWQGARSNA
jgi:homoserine kinase